MLGQGRIVGDTLYLLAELAVLFFTVALLIQLMQRRVGPVRLRNWMGGHPVVAALKGISIGFITPFCTYSAIPMLLGLRQAGVPVAGYVAFIMAAPVLDPVLFGALFIIVGGTAAGIYLVVAFVAAITLALIAQYVGIENQLKPLPAGFGGTNPEAPACSLDSAYDQANWKGLTKELPGAVSAATRLLRSVGPLLLLGVLIGIAIEIFVSPGAVAHITGNDSSFAIPAAAALGTPLYFSTALFVPIADSLAAAGVGIGAIVALTIAGSGANLPEFILLMRFAKIPLISAFFAYVFLVAVIGGTLAQHIVS